MYEVKVEIVRWSGCLIRLLREMLQYAEGQAAVYVLHFANTLIHVH